MLKRRGFSASEIQGARTSVLLDVLNQHRDYPQPAASNPRGHKEKYTVFTDEFRSEWWQSKPVRRFPRLALLRRWRARGPSVMSASLAAALPPRRDWAAWRKLASRTLQTWRHRPDCRSRWRSGLRPTRGPVPVVLTAGGGAAQSKSILQSAAIEIVPTRRGPSLGCQLDRLDVRRTARQSGAAMARR